VDKEILSLHAVRRKQTSWNSEKVTAAERDTSTSSTAEKETAAARAAE